MPLETPTPHQIMSQFMRALPGVGDIGDEVAVMLEDQLSAGGYLILPIRPTPQAIIAGAEACPDEHGEPDEPTAMAVWDAMINAPE